MRGICFCVGDPLELNNLLGTIKEVARHQAITLVVGRGMNRPAFLEDLVTIKTEVELDTPIRERWNIDVLVATHRSAIGKHLVEHWDRPQIKFLYQGAYAPTPDWLRLHDRLHTVWGLTDECISGFKSLDPFVVDASKTREIVSGPGPRLLDLMD